MASCTDVVHVGPWGGEGGRPWSFRTHGGRINSNIISTDGSIINSLEFGYTDKDGNSHSAGPFGTPLKPDAKVFPFVDDEDLIVVSGTFGIWSGLKVITSFPFQTNKKVYPKLGNEYGIHFLLPVRDVFEGFFENSGELVDSFGDTLTP